MQTLSLLLITALSALTPLKAAAQSDMIGTTGQFATETGMKGAVANREVADRLYKQSLEDESNAWKSFPPNVSLLSKALTESKDAKAADDQAKEFARAALHGMSSAAQSGDLSRSRYSGVDESKMRDLATNSSPYMPSVQNKLGGYGMKLDSDKMGLQTPFGKFPIGMASDMYEKTLRGVASLLGYKADDVSKGIQDAIRTRDGIAAQVQAGLKSGEATRAVAGAGSAAGTGATAPAESAVNPAAGPAGSDAATAAAGGDPATESALIGTENSLRDQRKEFLQRMGVSTGNDDDVRGDKNQDIFQMVHVKYQSLRAGGEFIEQEYTGERFASSGRPNR